MIFNKRIGILIFIIVFIRIVLVLFAVNLEGDDGGRYLTEAINLKNSGIFSTQNVLHPKPTAHDMPLFPGLIYVLLVLFKNQFVVLKIVSVLNCFFFGISAFAVYQISYLISNTNRIAFLSVLIYGLFPDSFPYSVFYMPESLFSAFLLFSIYYYINWLLVDSNKSLLFSYILLGLSILVKPISITILPIFISVGFVHLFLKKRLFKKLAIFLFSVLAGVSVILPWIQRNYKIFGIPEISSITGTNLFNCNYRYMLEDQKITNIDSVLNSKKNNALAKIDTANMNGMLESVILRKVAETEIKKNISHYFHTTYIRHPRLYLGTGTIALFSIFGDLSAIEYLNQFSINKFSINNVKVLPFLIQLVSWCLLFVFYILFFCGLIMLFRNKIYAVFFFLLLSILYLAIIIGPVVATRYRFVMLPFFSIGAAYGISFMRVLRTKKMGIK